MKNTLLMLALAAIPTQVWASGSTDYYCAAQKSQIRYEYHEADEGPASSIYRATGVNAKKAHDYLVTQNLLTLDAGTVSDMLITGDNQSFTLCRKTDGSAADYAKCIAGSHDSADLVEGGGAGTENNGVKYNRITQNITSADGTVVALDIRAYTSDIDLGAYNGKLTITAKSGAYKGTSTLDVQCSVSFP